MPPPLVAEHLRRIAAALRPLGIRWYVFGAQAVIAAGAVRQTADLDITTEDVPAAVLEAALRKAGFHLRSDIPGLRDLVEHHRVIPLQHRRSGFQLDVVRAGPVGRAPCEHPPACWHGGGLTTRTLRRRSAAPEVV